MVKTTYALTLFAAVSLAAPVPPAGNDGNGVGHMRRGGTGNFIGAGTADGAVNQMVENLAKPNSDHPESVEPKKGKADDSKAADKKGKTEKQHSILEDIPLVGPLLRPVPLVVKKRSFTGDLSNFPILGELFGGNQANPANSPHQEGGGQQPHILRDLNGLPQNYGENYGQNYGENAGQNYGENAGQNAGQNEGQNAGQNEGENEGQNWGQNWAQNYGENYGQNEGQNMRRSLTGELGDLPIVGDLLKGDQKHGKKESRQLHKALQLLHDLTASGPEHVSHKRDEQQSPEFDGLVKDAEGAANSATGLADNFMDFRRDIHENSARQVGGIADSVSGALDYGVDQDTDLADTIMPERRDTTDEEATPSQSSPKPHGSQEPKQSTNMLKEIASESGLGGLFGNAHHGLGLFPMNGRRDVHQNEARGGAPIQGSDLPSVLFSGGALGRLAKLFGGGGGQ